MKYKYTTYTFKNYDALGDLTLPAIETRSPFWVVTMNYASRDRDNTRISKFPVLTHVPSGEKINSSSFPSIRAAQYIAMALVALPFDWSQPEDAAKQYALMPKWAQRYLKEIVLYSRWS